MTTTTLSQFQIHTTETAPDAAVDTLKGVTKAYGFLPNLIANMAEAPALAEGYVTLAGIFGKTSFNATEQQIVLLSASFVNDCSYCMAAHSAVASMSKVPADVVESLRTNTPIADAKLEALRLFTLEVTRSQGRPSESAVESFLGAGYGRRQVLEVVLGVGLKTLSNFTHHIAETPLDDNFQATAWQKPD